MDKVTQSNAASAEESSAAAQELNSQAVAMQESVAQLLHLVGGGTGLPAREAPETAACRTPEAPQYHHPTPAKRRPAADSPPAPWENVPAGPAMNGRGVIAWDEASMATGVDTVDSQHKTLIERINELHAACLAGTAKEELLKMLSFLGDYAQSHFKHEEGVMDQHQCPARGKNKAAHAQFLADYASLVEIVKRDGATTTAVIQLKEMLGNWLKNHICNVDTQLRGCVQAHHN
jgi:hemerythrin